VFELFLLGQQRLLRSIPLALSRIEHHASPPRDQAQACPKI
jgi:hypothetical protein